MNSIFKEYSGVLVTIVVAVALIAIAMGIKVAVCGSVLDLTNNFNNKAQEILNFDEGANSGVPVGNNNYVGYYADVNDDGTVDGVIFFDYTQGADTTAGFLGAGVAVDSKTEGLASYELKTVDGKNNVVVKTGSGDDRFYVIGLENILPISPVYEEEFAYWYYNANDDQNLFNEYDKISFSAFGSGKQNTQIMKSKWDAEAYGAKKNGDMFTIEMGDWFVPSLDEWLVLSSNLKKVASGTYKDMSFESGASLSLADGCWSSTLNDTDEAYVSLFIGSCKAVSRLKNYEHVRLAITF